MINQMDNQQLRQDRSDFNNDEIDLYVVSVFINLIHSDAAKTLHFEDELEAVRFVEDIKFDDFSFQVDDDYEIESLEVILSRGYFGDTGHRDIMYRSILLKGKEVNIVGKF